MTGGIRKTKSLTIYNGVDINSFENGKDKKVRKELGLDENDIVVGAVGNIRKSKGYDFLLRAAQQLVQRSPKYKFIIAGENENSLYRELLTLREQLDLHRNVFFLGFRSDVASILRNIDIYVLSSTVEGFSISTVEAMSSGLPIVATRSGGPEEIVTHEETGLLVEHSSPKQIVTAIERLTGDHALKERLCRNAKRFVESRFSYDIMIRQYQAIYDSVTNTS
jgi:glycosyltransferase involved in cell wall biosynthesis